MPPGASQDARAFGLATPLAQPSASVDFEVRNRVGTLLFTSPDPDLAKQWLSDRKAAWPGAQVEEVTRWETRRRVYRPQPQLRRVV